MNGFRFVKGAAVSLATLGMVFPQVTVLADGPAAPVKKASQTAGAPDVALTAGGTLSGRVVDHTGKVIEGAQVTVRQGKTEVSKTVTNKEGVVVVQGTTNHQGDFFVTKPQEDFGIYVVIIGRKIEGFNGIEHAKIGPRLPVMIMK